MSFKSLLEFWLFEPQFSSLQISHTSNIFTQLSIHEGRWKWSNLTKFLWETGCNIASEISTLFVGLSCICYVVKWIILPTQTSSEYSGVGKACKLVNFAKLCKAKAEYKLSLQRSQFFCLSFNFHLKCFSHKTHVLIKYTFYNKHEAEIRQIL